MLIHVAICHFAPLTDLGRRRSLLLGLGKNCRLRGQLNLTPEGIEAYFTGPSDATETLLEELRTWPGCADLVTESALSNNQPFDQLRVSIQDELGGLETTPGFAAKRFHPGVSCPDCYQTETQELQQKIEGRRQRLWTASHPLPGSQARDTFKLIKVRQNSDRKTLLDALRENMPHLPASHWEQEAAEGRILDQQHRRVSLQETIREGQIFLHLFPDTLEPEVNPDVEILHEDEAVVVIHKPAPLPMHAGGRFFRNTLQYLLNAAYHPEQLRPAHRLDANTTGILIATRTQRDARRLQTQFARGQVEKKYLVRVHGHPSNDRFHCDAPISAESRALGSRAIDVENGLPACTRFRVLRRDPDGTTLLEAIPITGRTNQIRLHLWHLGYPVCGDQVYRSGDLIAATQTLACGAPPLQLHAWWIRFEHPLDQSPREFTAIPPDWAKMGPHVTEVLR